MYIFDSTDQAGTFWYHSHLCKLQWLISSPELISESATQYCDGLRGPFIIYDSDDPHADLYDVDDGSSCWYLMSLFFVYSVEGCQTRRARLLRKSLQKSVNEAIMTPTDPTSTLSHRFLQISTNYSNV